MSKRFSRFAKHERISDALLIEAVNRAVIGLIDADLGGGVIKQRIARSGQGRSSGFRTIILIRRGDKAFYVYGFTKSERDNITSLELQAFKELASEMLNYSEDILQRIIHQGGLIEVKHHEE